MTRNIEVKTIFQRYLLYYDIKPTEAARLILEGYLDIDEAKETLELYGDREIISYTAHGFEVSPTALRQAIKIMEMTQ